MGPAARQVRALLRKNGLCRLRSPVLSLAEFFWPCILFMILIVLRFQEPPRHRDNCYLQPRDLPSQGVFPFVQGLLCNTGSRCRNISYAESTEHHFRLSRFQSTAGRHKKISDLVFFQEMQDLAEEIYEMMDKATNLQKLWVERSKTPDSSYGSGFLTMDLNKTEEVISKLESLQQQPHIWDFLLLLPGLATNSVHSADGIGGGVHLLQAVSRIFHTPENAQLSLEQTHYWDMLKGFIRKTCEMARYVTMPGGFQNGPPAFSEESPCYKENIDWKIISDNYFAFLKNFLKSPVASISRLLNSTKELLMMEKKWRTLEDEHVDFLLSFVEFLQKLLLPESSHSPGVPQFRNPPSLTEASVNTRPLWVNHLKSLEGEPSGSDTQKFLELGKEMIEKIQTLERKESRHILRFMELLLLEINPQLLELWMDDISKGERPKAETSSILLNFSVPENERILSKSFNFSQLFRSDWPKSPAVEMDFVHLSETIINSLYEFGFLRRHQVSEVLDAVYAVRNVSAHFLTLSEPQKQEIDKVLTRVSLNVFKDKDAALLLQISSSFYQHIYKFLSIRNTEALLSVLTQISKHILDIIKQFNFQSISKAFTFLYEATEVLGGISEVSYCQQLLSAFNLLELRAQSLMSAEGHKLEVIPATLTGLKRLFTVDEEVRVSLFQYMNYLFNGSAEALLGNECFAVNNKSISSVNYSIGGGSPFSLPWTQILSNLSANGSAFNEFMAVHCTVSWLQMWTEIWGSVAQILKVDVNVFSPLHVGLTQLLDELESNVNISKTCEGIFPTHRPATLLLHLFENVTQADGFHNPDDLLTLRDLWVALGDAFVRVKSLNLGQVEESLFTVEATLSQLKAFPFNASASREGLYPLLDVFIELSNTSEYVGRNVHLINHFLSNNATNYGAKLESIITNLRETVLFLRNVSHDQDLLSCADIFQNVTEFILEDGLLYLNTSQRTLHILAMLNSTFSSEDTISRLKGCIEWMDIINHLRVTYHHPSSSQGHLQGALRSFRDVRNKINSTLKLVKLMMESGCSLNKSNINCVNTYLENVTDFLNVILTAVFEKEKVPKFEILLSLLNDSTDQIRMIIHNLTRDFEFASQSNWKHFTESILRPTDMSNEIPSQFQNIWLHLVALGKEIKKLAKDIFPNILENNSSEMEKFFNVFATSPKEKDIKSLGNSFFHLASYLAFNLSHDLQNSAQIIPHEVMQAVGLGIQLISDVFSSLMPSVHHSSPEGPGNSQSLKKVTSLLRALRKTNTDLLVDQLEQIGEGLVDFFKNVSRVGIGHLGVNMLVGLVEKVVDSSRSWDVAHLLRLSRLFPRDDVNTVVDASYALPHVARLLHRIVDKNITEALKDVYDFTLLHGMSISNVTREDFAVVIKTLLDTVELITDKPGVLAEALTCLPVLWCRNHTTPGFHQNPKLEACHGHELMSSSFYSKVASMLDHLHLSPPGDVSQCSNESSQMEITRKMVCLIHELGDWNSILLELSEAFHVKSSLVNTMQEFWQKVLPFVPSSGNQRNGSMSGLCSTGPVKQVALQLIEKLKNVNFTNITSHENILHKLASLNKILNLNEGTEEFGGNVSLNLERIIKSLFGDQSLENSAYSLASPFMAFLNATLAGSNLEALSGFIKKSEATYNFEELWLEFQQTVKDLNHDLNIRQLFSEINKDIQIINSVALQNITFQLAHLLESLNSSSLQALEITEDFLSVTKNWLHKYTNEEYSRMIQTSFLLMANKSSADDLALLTEGITTCMGYLKNISREVNFDDALLTQLVNQEQLADFSVVQLLLGSFLIHSANNLAGSSQEAAWNLSDADLQIMNFMDFPMNQTQSEKGERIILSPGSRVEFTDQLLKTFFSFLQKGNYENRLSLLCKDFPKDVTAEMGFIPKDKILEILKVDQFFTSMTEDKLMSISSSLKETMYHLIRSLFLLDNGEFSFDSHRGLQFMRGLFNVLLRETSMKNKTGTNLEFLALVSQLLFHTNSSEDLFKLSHDLRSALHLVRETSVAIANLRDTLLLSFNKDFHGLEPMLQQVILANLTDLLFFVNTSFPLRNRATLQITKRLLGIVSRAGGESQVPEPLMEMSNTLTMLMSDIAEMEDLVTSTNSIVKLLELAKKVSGKMVTLFETHVISSTNDTMKFFDTLYSILQHSVQNVNEIRTLKKVDHSVYENINDLVTPFLDLAFGMIGVKPNISQDSDIFNMSSNIGQCVNKSKDFSDILKEIAEFLTSGKINLGDVEHFLVAVHNGTQIFSMDSVNIWEEILDCLVPINDITNQIDFLHPNPISSRSFRQGAHEVIPSLGELLSQNSTELETFLRMVTDLTLEALWNNFEENKGNVFNLWLTLARHPNTLWKAVERVVEVSGGVRGGSSHDLGEASVLAPSLSQNAAPEKPDGTPRSVLPRTALPRAEVLHNSQWANSTRTSFQPILEVFSNASTGNKATSGKEEKTEKDVFDSPYACNPLPHFKNYVKGLLALIEHWQEVPLTRQSVAEMCQGSWQPGEPAVAVTTLQRVKMLVLRAILILAENPSLAQDVLCAALSYPHGGIRRLLVSGLRGVAAVRDHYQEIENIWSSPGPLDCEGLSGKLAGAMERLRSHLETASARDCACEPTLDGDPRQVHTLVQNLEKTLFSGNPIMTFLSNFTVTADVKVKDLMKNVTDLTEALRSSIPLSDGTVSSILEASLPHSQVLSSALTVALSGRCDQDVLGLLLALPEDEVSGKAAKELCGLPGAEVFALIVCMSRNLDLRTFIYRTLIPAEASGMLSSLLDVVSRLNRLLPKAGRILEHLPEFLHTLKIPALLDTPGVHQASRSGQARSTAFGSFQSVMKMVCKEQESFLSNSHAFINLPRVHELLGDDKEKFNIPEDSTPFCLKLYQDILQSPNGALVWSFLKPILHGKILYTPNTPRINKVIRKANYTFLFVDKLKTLSETLLKVSSAIQGTGNGQALSRLQKALGNKFIRKFVESQLHISVDKLTEKLQTYRRVLGRTLSHLGAGRLHFLGHVLANLSSCVRLDRFQAFESTAVLEAKAQALMRHNSFLASVIFNSSLADENFRSELLPLPPHVTYTIRTSALYSMRTDLVKNPFWKFHPQSLPADGFKYNYVFVPLQDMIERAIILEQTGQETVEPAAQAQAIPYPCHRSDLFLNNVGFFFPLIMMLTWMVSVASMVRKLVYEREIQIEEYLRMMGVHPAAHFLAWFLENVAVVTISSAALAVVLNASGIFAYSNPFVVFLFLLDFGVSVVMLSYFLSAFFRQANTAALCTCLVYMISFLPYIILLVLHNQLSVTIQTLLCLLSTTAFGQGVFFITFLEGQEAGVQWGNMYESPEHVGMAFGWICWVMLFDSGLYFLCGWYLSNLIPGAFGLRKPWYFPVTASYWKGVCGSVVKSWCALCARLVFRQDLDSKGSSAQNGTGTLDGGPLGVTLVSVTKEHQPGRAAVRDLTVTFHSGQISALLGSNGAGKTSVISMLTGLYPPTSGTIIVNGKNLQTDLAAVRKELGVCPQQDVLFDTLTVREHLLLFASIKAPQWSRAELQQHVHRTLRDVGLTSHQHKQARALSGGLKRKLSIGIAFLGTSRTVVLDEPTSGVDPCSRRSIWDILLQYRAGRTLIFTTHHLDEAEALSDCVAVLQHGRLRCWAPPSCLTEAYGQGLSLTLTRQPSALEVDDAKATAGATALIQTYVPRAFLKASSGRELSYAVPKDADRACFKGLFQALEQNLHRLHMTGYGVSDATLEEFTF
ncbi:ATP-binding cassette sub-family A member 13 isoform 2-T2 [Hipposideros larvatus]